MPLGLVPSGLPKFVADVVVGTQTFTSARPLASPFAIAST